MALDNGLAAVGDRRREDLLEELALLKKMMIMQVL